MALEPARCRGAELACFRRRQSVAGGEKAVAERGDAPSAGTRYGGSGRGGGRALCAMLGCSLHWLLPVAHHTKPTARPQHSPLAQRSPRRSPLPPLTPRLRRVHRRAQLPLLPPAPRRLAYQPACALPAQPFSGSASLSPTGADATLSAALPPALPLPCAHLQPVAQQEMRVENNGIPPLPSQQPRQQAAGGLFGRSW